MYADKELAKKIVQYVKEDARRAYASSFTSLYSFSKYCKENKMFSSDDIVRGHDHFIHCPFHEDESPSLSFNEEIGVWNCFSCNRGGSYIDFVLSFENEVLGNSVTFYEKLNQFLKNDANLRNSVGATSIFQENKLNDFQPITRLKIDLFDNIPHSYLELSTQMLEKGCSNESIAYAVLLMQSGMTPEEIYKNLKKDNAW